MNRSMPGLPVHHQLPEFTQTHQIPEFTQTHIHRVGDAIQPSHPLSSPSPPAPNPSQHQTLFQWVNSSHEVAKVLEFQLEHHSFQKNPRADLLQNGLVGSCGPRDSQESSPTPQFNSISSSALSFLHSLTLTSIHDHWENHSLVYLCYYYITKPFLTLVLVMTMFPLLKLKEKPMLCGSLDWRGVWGRMDPYICLGDSLSIHPKILQNCKLAIVRSPSSVQLFVTSWTAAGQAYLSPTISWGLPKFMWSISDAIQPSHSLSPSSPSAFNLS